MDRKLVCPCGLTCCDCLFYKSEIYESAIKLKEVIKDSQLDIFLRLISEKESWEAIENIYAKTEARLAGILNHLRNCLTF